VLNALLNEARGRGVTMIAGARVTDVARQDEQTHRVITRDLTLLARHVVLATGGRSLPKSGSDGVGFEIARRLGHSIVPPTPALVPLLLENETAAMHRALTGVAHERN
jgi:predicted flavoprotein YhiN